jgi:hydroxymethylpyrimidine pyrophosphatase-like HAD family hydrolase
MGAFDSVLVVTDLDSTFWPIDTMRAPQATLDALVTLRAEGADFLAATGRRSTTARSGLADHGLYPPAVVLNGSYGLHLDSGERFHSAGFSPHQVAAMEPVLAPLGVSPLVYCGDGTVQGREAVSTTAKHRASLGDEFIGVHSGGLGEDAEVLCVGAMGAEESVAAEAVALLRDAGVGEGSHYFDGHYGGWAFMMQAPGVNKATGVASYLDATGIQPEFIVAVGDGNNDLELLEMADLAVGVEGGHPDALARAHTVIAPAADAGWAKLPQLIADSLQ